MAQDLMTLPTDQLLSKFGSGGHKPGSGSAAALLGLVSCKLAQTVVSLSAGRDQYVGVSMYALDRTGSVIYLGTYSKTLCPSVRVGYAVVPSTLFGDAKSSRTLISSLGERKSFITLNTSQLNQALVAGILLTEGGSLARQVSPQVDYYRTNRDQLITCLGEVLGSFDEDIRWNHPQGGFFLTLALPFQFGRAEMVECAKEHQIIPMPMSFFALDESQQKSVRIAFSNMHPEAIAQGVERLGNFVREKIWKAKNATL